MDVVVDFLLEYYVWVLVVLVILLITVIGFLVDTKRKKKLRENADNTSSVNAVNSNSNNMGMMEQNVNNLNPNMNNFNDGINNDIFNPNMNNNMNNFDVNMNQNVNAVVPNMNLGMNNLNNNMMGQNIMADNNIVNPNVSVDSNLNNSDSFFVPTSEQSPVFAPGNVVIPTPVETVSVMGSTPTPVIEPIPVQNVNTIPNQNVVNNNMIEQSIQNMNTVPNNGVVGVSPAQVMEPIQTPILEEVKVEVPNFNMSNVVPSAVTTQPVQEQVSNMNVIPNNLNMQIPAESVVMNQGVTVEPVAMNTTNQVNASVQSPSVMNLNQNMGNIMPNQQVVNNVSPQVNMGPQNVNTIPNGMVQNIQNMGQVNPTQINNNDNWQL